MNRSGLVISLITSTQKDLEMQNTRRIAIVGMAAAMAFGLAACGKKDEAKPAASGADAQPQAQASSSGITGAGASFPAPLYSKWAAEYAKASNVKVNYQSVGSGAGMKQIEAKTVDFGASDEPLKDEDLKAKGLVQFPTVVGGNRRNKQVKRCRQTPLGSVHHRRFCNTGPCICHGRPP